MKQCCQCGMFYSDPSMNYCLDDGTLLSATDLPYHEAKTEQVTYAGSHNAYRVVERIITKNVGAHAWTLKYPQLEDLPNPYIRGRINYFLRTSFTVNLYAEEEILAGLIEEGEKFTPGENRITYEVGIVADELLCIKQEDYFHDEENKPTSRFRAWNIELSSGYRTEYRDHFLLDSDYLVRIPELVQSSLSERGLAEDHPEKEYELFLRTDELEVINLYCRGNQFAKVLIPYVEIKSLIHPQSLLGKYLTIT